MKHSAVIVLAIALLMTAVLTGCGTTKSSTDTTKATTGTKASSSGTAASSDMAKDQVFRMNLGTEPPSLDPGKADDNASFTVLNGIFEGLTRSQADGSVVPGVAEKWDVSTDGKTWTFHLRTDAKFSNGDPVTAEDFVYAWQRALSPALASQYAYQLYYLVGAEDYNAGKVKDASTVGVKALDAHTLQVQLKSPAPYFKSLSGFITYFPVDKKVVEANAKWAFDAATLVSNGPFMVSQWKHKDTLVLKKNPNYWDKKSIKLSEVDFSMVEDNNTELNMYDTNQIDWAGSPTGSVPSDLIPKLKSKKDFHISGQAAVYYYEFNNKKKPFDNVKVRKALSMAINREDIVNKVTLGGQIAAYGIVTPGITGIGEKSFRDLYNDHTYFKEDVAAAKTLLAEGLKEENMTKMPDNVELLYNTSNGHKKIAEAIAQMWKQNLGINVTLKHQEWKVFLKTRQSLNYDIARAGWGADYNDPMTFIDLFTTASGNNDTGFSNAEYDKDVKDAYATNDAKKRMDLMADAEKVLVQDQMGIAPIYYYTNVYEYQTYVKDIKLDGLGNLRYTRGYIAKH